MKELKQISLNPIDISIEPKTNLLLIKQNQNEIKLTRDQVIQLKKLREGQFENNVCTSTLIPRNKFKMNDKQQIIASCQDELEDNTVVINKTKRYDDLERICNFVDANKGHIAWSRDFRKMR